MMSCLRAAGSCWMPVQVWADAKALAFDLTDHCAAVLAVLQADGGVESQLK